MKKFLIVLYKFIRGIFRFVYLCIIGIICRIIYAVTYEKGKEKKITPKKAKRIRILTNFKLMMFKNFPHLIKFLGEAEYLTYLKNKLNYGV